MPSGYLHKRCAERACELAGITPVERDVLVLGAQGPDPLFVLGVFPLRPSSKLKPHGNTLHTTRTGAFLVSLARHARDKGPVERAFAMGFLTHYALDSTVHPYVNAHSRNKKGAYDGLVHMRLEKWWDTLYYRREGHTGTVVTMPGVAETKRHWPVVAAVWMEAIREVYPEMDVTERDILAALRDTERVNRLTHSPRGVKYALVWVAERLIGRPLLGTSQMGAPFLPKEDIENTARLPWRNPANPDIERNEGLAELFATAVRRAGELLLSAGQYFDREMDEVSFAAIVGNLGFDTGMESKP